MLTIEAFAHYMRGAVTLFFIFWCFKLRAYIRRSRMMKLLYVATLYLTFSFLKDGVFLFNPWKNSEYLDNLVNVVDLLYYPLVCAFFLEAVRPGFSTTPRIVAAFLVQALFVLLFLVYPTDTVVGCAYVVSNIMSLYTIIAVLIYAFRYQYLISINYSYHDHIDVVWVAVSCLVYFLTHYIYMYAFDHTTWLSEALYFLYSMVIWTALFLLSQRHKVVLTAASFSKQLRPSSANQAEQSDPIESAAESNAMIEAAPVHLEDAASETIQTSSGAIHSEPLPDATEMLNATMDKERENLITQRLRICMENEKPYLTPKLSLGDLALCIGTNKTYLSDYFNNSLHLTFYEYINGYRVGKAEELILAMAMSNRINMDEVAERSGFNSLSSFNRYFMKIHGVTPKQFYFSCTRMPDEKNSATNN